MIILINLILLIIYGIYIEKYLNIMQQEKYRNGKYFEWLKNNINKTFVSSIIQFLLITFIYIGLKVYFGVESKITLYGTTLSFVVINIVNIFINKMKNKIIYTDRVKRLYIFNIIVMIGFAVPFNMLVSKENYSELSYFYSLILIFAPIFNMLGNTLLTPIEKNIDARDIKSTTHKLKILPNLIKIAIIGEEKNNKFSIILNQMLSEKYKVLLCDQKDNSLADNVRVIKNGLKDKYEIIIINMSFKQKKDSEKFCDIVRPNYSVITDISKQEDEEYKTIEAIIKDKNKIIEKISESGMIFLPSDDELCYHIYTNETGNKALYGIEPKRGIDITAQDISVEEDKFVFTLKAKKEQIKCSTLENDLQSVLGCAAIAKKLEFTMQEIKEGIGKL